MYRIILVFFLIIYLDSSRASPGGLDTSFGINGLTSVAIGDNAFATSLYLSENSEILVGGVAYPNSRWAVAKVNSTGQPVVSFGTGGTKTFQFSLLGGGVSALAHQGLSEILLGSDTGFGNSLIRINQFGEQDLTFGIEGRAMINFADAQNPIATGIVVLSSAKILVSGYVRTSDSETQGFILRLLPNGTVDSSFGSSGRILFNISGYRETLVVDFKENPTQSNYFLAGTACRDQCH